jgi:MGT family glycosyltransferase
VKILCTSQIGSSTVLGQTMRVAAIAKALQRRGAQVKYLAGEKLIPVIQSHGIEIIPLPSMPEIELFPNEEQLNDQAYQKEMGAKLVSCFQLSLKSEKEALVAERPDLMLCGSPLSMLTAREEHVPGVLTMLQPHGKKTLEYFMKKMKERAALNNVIAASISNEDYEKTFSEAMEMVQLIFLEGMPEISGDLDLNEIERDFPEIKEKIQKIKSKIQFTGPLLVERPEKFPSREELKLRYTGNQSQPLVYITIGGGTTLIGEEFLNLVIEAFRSLPDVKAVISTGLAISAEKIGSYRPPENVVIHQFVPGIELIKASDVTIFHGGSSTLMNCIACGKPGVVVPSMAEQEDNGRVLAQNGAGILLDKQGLTPVILMEAVLKILRDSSFHHQADKLKQLGEKYGGAEGAATMIEKLVEERSLAYAGSHFSSR